MRDIQNAHENGYEPTSSGIEAQRRASNIPERLDRYHGGPPAPPSQGIFKADLDEKGHPRTGTLFNSTNAISHRYITRNALPEGLSRDQATEVFRRFNAPTRDALQGRGNDPSLNGGVADPSAPFPRSARGTSLWGGNIEFTRGATPDGRPWAINTAVQGQHPLTGHATRTLEEYDGRYYIRTDGVGNYSNPLIDLASAVSRPSALTRMAGAVAGVGQQLLNYIIGPRVFNNLDVAACDYARRTFGLQQGSCQSAPPSPVQCPQRSRWPQWALPWSTPRGRGTSRR
jgi:hypothetical protein